MVSILYRMSFWIRLDDRAEMKHPFQIHGYYGIRSSKICWGSWASKMDESSGFYNYENMMENPFLSFSQNNKPFWDQVII